MHHLADEDPPELTQEVQAVISEFQGKIDSALSNYVGGAFIKLNTHSPRDSVLDRNDSDHIQAVEVWIYQCVPFVCSSLVML